MSSASPKSRWARITRRTALHALGLDVSYERAEGSRVWYRNPDEHCAWDFLGGFGATFFGHNHPALSDAAIDFLKSRRVVHGQASVCAASDRLERELARRLEQSVSRAFEIVLSNTGSEAVEVAAKHAEQVLAAKRGRLATELETDFHECASLRWSEDAIAVLRAHGIEPGSEAQRRISEHNRRVLSRPAVHLAVQRSYHGMTARALALTHDPACRFGHSDRDQCTRFVDARDPAGLSNLLSALGATVLHVHEHAGVAEIDTPASTSVASFFVEPVQGEGGIHPLDPTTARAWRAACDRHDVPIVADEIQSGLGRTGTFLYCEQLGLRPDYVLLGKSLGGGLAKLSAVAIALEHFIPEFTLQHASTFAGDDFSSHVALRALALLDEEDALAVAAAKGEHLLHALRDVGERHPRVIANVRGRGLMLGIEWHEQEFDRSNLLRLLQEHGWLGYAFSGYLLRARGVRVAPTVAGRNTLRIEPAYSVPLEAIEELVGALDELCRLLESQDAAGILGPCMDVTVPHERATPVPRIVRRPDTGSHVGFIGHFIDAADLDLWDANFTRLAPCARRMLLDRLQPFVEPVVAHRDHVASKTGATTTFTFVGLAVPSVRFYRALRTNERRELRDLVQRAVDLAADEGCSVVGLGGYCSIITRNGRDLRSNGVGLTTGNGYAVGAGLEAMRATARDLGIEWQRARAAVIGATGNIGSVLAELLASEVSSLVLLTRPTRCQDLEPIAGRILRSLATQSSSGPMAAVVRDLIGARENDLRQRDGTELFRFVRDVLGSDCPITIGSDPTLCRGANVIATATNEVHGVLLPHHLSDGPIVIADLSVPADVDPSIARQRQDVRVIRGGIIRTPASPQWRLPGVPLAPGEMYACMTETVLMGLEGHVTHGSIGPLTPERVRTTVAMAARHGFSSIRSTTASRY